MISVAVTGAAGRMGTAVWNAVQNDPGLELVGCIDPSAVGQLLGGHTVLASLDELDVTPEVVIDFTVAAAAVATMEWCVDHHVHVVVGTTGLDSAWMAGLGEKAHANGTGVLVAANFAIGAVLMMRLSEIAAPFFESVEIIEEHHNMKKDAPSGTALVTAERIAAVSGEWGSDPTEHELLPGAWCDHRRGNHDSFTSREGSRRASRSRVRHNRANPAHPPRLTQPRILHAGHRSCCRVDSHSPWSHPWPRIRARALTFLQPSLTMRQKEA